MAEQATRTFVVRGMHCNSCGLLIDEMVEELEGVDRSETNVSAERTTVTFDPSSVSTQDIVQAVAEAGYQAAPAEAIGGSETSS